MGSWGKCNVTREKDGDDAGGVLCIEGLCIALF